MRPEPAGVKLALFMKAIQKVACLLLPVLAIPVFGTAGAGRAGIPPVEDDGARSRRGEVVVQEIARHGRSGSATASVSIRAPVARVWRVMTDCARAPEFVPNLRTCRVLERHPGGRLVEHRVKPFRLLPELVSRFEERWDEPRRIDFHRVGGDFATLEGSWELEPVGEQGTLVRYTVTIEPGFPVPGWYLRRAVRQDLVRLLGALRDRVERGGGTP
jgi:coenzyme Q-binding protein COQ10